MIVWSGRGILSALVFILSLISFNSLLPMQQSGSGLIGSLFVAAAFSWFMGKKWNEQEGQVLMDKASGKEFMVKPNHSLFWIKMQYWGIIFALLGLLALIQELV
jgi:hypothetical protein